MRSRLIKEELVAICPAACKVLSDPGVLNAGAVATVEQYENSYICVHMHACNRSLH